MNYSIVESIVNILLFLLILYISKHSQITKDVKFRIPFWTMIILWTITLTWFNWDYPDFRVFLLVEFAISIVTIYFLNFRKRLKSGLDYLKLSWVIVFFTGALTINFMKYFILKEVNISFVNSEGIILLDRTFNITILFYSLLIAGIIYSKNASTSRNEQNDLQQPTI